MAENQSVSIPAHHNVYNGFTNRELRIDFSIPDSELNEETGILILVPGFGANIDSKVYKKMRENFSDKYNLVTVQCDYFGSEFMQSAKSFNFKYGLTELLSVVSEAEKKVIGHSSSKLLQVLSTKSITVPVIAKLEETIDQFNDMGIMQAIDVITAIETIKILLKENNLMFNENKVIGYGHSHGAYLIHLCNRLSPHLFSHIIDNSAWIEPVYLKQNRFLIQPYNNMNLQIEFDYMVKKLIEDFEALSLFTLYNHFNNQAKMISFQGNEDILVDHYEKERLLRGITNSKFVLVDKNSIDNEIFKSNKHGLDADFLKLFNRGIEELGVNENNMKALSKYEILLSKTKINVDYTYGLPVFERSVVLT